MNKTFKELTDAEVLKKRVPNLLVRKLKCDWEDSSQVFAAIKPQTSKRIPYKYPKWILDNYGYLHLIVGYYKEENNKLGLFSFEVDGKATFFWWWNIDEKKKLITKRFNEDTYLTVPLTEKLSDTVQRKFKLSEEVLRKENYLNTIPAYITPFKMNIRSLQKRKEDLDGIE